MSSINVVLCNCPADHAEALANALVEQRLAACVNLVPGVRSVYRWEGRVQTESEVMLLIKTASDRVGDLREGILALHPYALPEVVVLRVDGSASHLPYLEWVAASTQEER